MLPRLVLLLCVAGLAPAVGVGCGGGDDKPTSVSADDLKDDGEFWADLTPDLKDELVELAQDQLGEERPDGAAEIDAIDTGKAVAEMDKQYANQGKRGESIYDTYVQANDIIARETYEGLVPELREGPP